ncbi:MAG: LytTR family DNA-binding domain-containing protein [Eubacteriales bacterium]|nr:LytTR family DNA-binding domain-containing protein [Eubacteriales bacterium]
MQVEIKIDSSYAEPKIIILTAAMTEDVTMIIDKLSKETPQIISGSKNEKIEVIEQGDLVRVYANAGKVFAVTDKGEYTIRLRLYEMEERLNSNQFVRISNSEIINLKKVKNFDLSFTGTICVELVNGTTTYVSRRYVSKIKTILNMR